MVGEEVKTWLKNKLGLDLLKTENGIESFRKVINYPARNIVVIEGDRDKIKKHLGIAVSNETEEKESASAGGGKEKGPDIPGNELMSRTEKDLKDLCVELLKVREEDLDPEVDFSEYGVDSIMMMKMLNSIELMYGETVDPNSIAMNPTIRQFARYLISEGIVKARKEPVEESGGSSKQTKEPQLMRHPDKKGKRSGRFVGGEDRGLCEKYHKIAVIGMACRFPGSSSLEAFWKHLRDKDELITEIPSERWIVEEYFSEDKAQPGKSYSKWGGFIKDIDAFDAEYFGVSDEDAKVMHLSSVSCWS